MREVNGEKWKATAGRLFADYGMVLVLLLLCVLFSAITWELQHPEGSDAADQVVRRIRATHGPADAVLIGAGKGDAPEEFVARALAVLKKAGWTGQDIVVARKPAELRKALVEAAAGHRPLSALGVTSRFSQLPLLDDVRQEFPGLGDIDIFRPGPYWGPTFLTRRNLVDNVAYRSVVIAVIAIGMTMVIITAGIDLSVGSLIALSAVLTTCLIREWAGGYNATAAGMILCCLGAIAACGLVGCFSGVMVTLFSIPPFIVTLAMMLIASGLAFMIAGGQSIYQVPPSIDWLGRGRDLFGVPNIVVMMVILYAIAHILMRKTVLGRYIYAVGGNVEAARLSGVPVRRVLLFVYSVCGALAGLGGVVQASKLRTGAATYGQGYELDVIAATVVGGTSLAGGQGRILGTLIGALIIGVIRNGMNLTGVKPYPQKVVLGAVILGAVLLDMLKKRRWRRPRFWTRRGGRL